MVLAIILIIIFAILVPVTTYIIFSSPDSDGGDSENGDSGNGDNDGHVVYPTVDAENPSEKSYAWIITIARIGGGTFNLEDAKFRLFDDANIRICEREVSEVNPASFNKGASKIYAIPSGNSVVSDAYGYTIDQNTQLQDYHNCSMAYIDQDNNRKVSAGDSIFIYKDNDNDGTDEVFSGYTFELLYKEELAMRKIL